MATRWHPAMRLALEQAEAAARHDDVPIGAVVLDPSGAVIARAGNERELHADPTAHAEVVAIRRAAEAVIWGMPAVNFDLMFQAMLKAGGKANGTTWPATTVASPTEKSGWPQPAPRPAHRK